MKCPKCEKEIDDNAVFCQFCGNKIEQEKNENSSVENADKSENSGYPVGKIILIIIIAVVVFVGIMVFIIAKTSYRAPKQTKETQKNYSNTYTYHDAEAQERIAKMAYYDQRNKDLSISNNGITHNSSYTICEGSIKNNGSESYKFIKVKGSFKDKNGNVVDTDGTYAIGSEGLDPGESTTFRLSIKKNSDVVECKITYEE